MPTREHPRPDQTSSRPRPRFARAPLFRARLLMAVAAVLVASACTIEVSPQRPDGPVEPGFHGSWAAEVKGSRMTLSIEQFGGRLTTGGRLRWQEVDWPLECSIFADEEEIYLNCEVAPTGDVCFDPANNGPFIEVLDAVPTTSITAEVGGRVRSGTDEPCDGPIVADWDPPVQVVFLPA